MDKQAPTRVLVVYPFMHHYRFGVFSALEADRRLTVTFASARQGRNGVETIPRELFRRHVETRTTNFKRFSYQSKIFRLALSPRYDSLVFLGDVWSLSTWLGAAAGRLRRKKVLFWTIGWHRPERGLIKLLRISFYRLADELLLYGNVGKTIGVAMGYAPERMTVIYNSHVSSQQAAVLADGSVVAQLTDASRSVGAVVRLNPTKRLDLLIEAVGLLKKRGLDVGVILAGEGPERDRLSWLAKSKGVRVVFLGAVYAESDLRAIYSRLRATVIPAAAGLSVIQSLSHGVPVITDDDDYGQMPEAEAIQPGVTGSRFARGDVTALAEAIERWLPERDDAALTRAAEEEITARWSATSQARAIAARILAWQEKR